MTVSGTVAPIKRYIYVLLALATSLLVWSSSSSFVQHHKLSESDQHCNCQAPLQDEANIKSKIVPTLGGLPGLLIPFDLEFDKYMERHKRALLDIGSHSWIIADLDVGGGLGNRLPGLVNGVLLALLTNRTLLIRYPDYIRRMWDFAVDFDLENYQIPGELFSVMEDMNRTLIAVSITEDFATYFDQARPWMVQGWNYNAPFLQANPHYRDRIKQLFPDGRVSHHILRRAIRLNNGLSARLAEYTKSKFRPYTIGIHIRSMKLSNIASMRTYATIALDLADASGRPSHEIGFHIAADSESLRNELALLLGQERVTYLPIRLSMLSSIGNPGGSDEEAAMDFVALGSGDAVVATYGSSFGQWAGAWSGRNYVTVNQQLTNYSNNKEVAFWKSIKPEPCSFLSKWFTQSPTAAMSPHVGLVAERPALERRAVTEEDREAKAVALLMASPQYLSHAQCHPQV
ncbi:hypothetical protein SmJEL517_g02681 [Synchytrium microbalum]|uniref:O-fucosyltransferase family protein n=1 Tax=Synchytrium microbalum TaxID=1806994 RepID=A0A507BZF4_9FUNG|nr:uncharacterized protein SmJEL517_g02681 [Synchytrium microbalum]TPX34650.1 hypothetical protein SmJEL517_g02681 [Synchytrium microbalum]